MPSHFFQESYNIKFSFAFPIRGLGRRCKSQNSLAIEKVKSLQKFLFFLVILAI